MRFKTDLETLDLKMTLFVASNYLFTVPWHFPDDFAVFHWRSKGEARTASRRKFQSKLESPRSKSQRKRVGTELSGSEVKARFCKILVKYRRHSRFILSLFHFTTCHIHLTFLLARRSHSSIDIISPRGHLLRSSDGTGRKCSERCQSEFVCKLSPHWKRHSKCPSLSNAPWQQEIRRSGYISHTPAIDFVYRVSGRKHAITRYGT